jgi:hypothetical protein
MHKNMKSRIEYNALSLLFSFGLLMVLSSDVYGQSVDKIATAEANVLTDISLDGTQDLEYTTVLQNTQKYIDVLDGAVKLPKSTGVTGGEKRGYFTIEGTVGTKMNIEITFPASLLPNGTVDNINPQNGIDYHYMNSDINTWWNVTDVNSTNAAGTYLSPHNDVGAQIIIVEEDPSTVSELNNDIVTGGNGIFGDGDKANAVDTYTFDNIQIPENNGERKIYVVFGGLIDSRRATSLDVYTADIELTTTIISD